MSVYRFGSGRARTMKSRWIVLLGLFQLADIATTYCGIELPGIGELNPYVSRLLEQGIIGWVAFFGSKVFVVALVTWMRSWFTSKFQIWVWRILMGYILTLVVAAQILNISSIGEALWK